MKIRAIITGATGMVGEGVLHECLQSDAVESVLIINRNVYGLTHPKLKQIIHKDFFDISPIKDQLEGYNACFFCLGVTSLGKGEEEYTKLTYDLTMDFAKELAAVNPDLIFCYVSGASTDSTEKGKLMWARVKGKTENDLVKLPFRDVYAYRPGYMQPTKGLKNTQAFYKFISWMYPVLKTVAPNSASTLKELGLSMINIAINGYSKKILEVSDIIATAK